MAHIPTEKELKDFALKIECEIIPRLKSAGFERNKYNVFNILRLNRQELKHSEFLAFLMNPDQSGDVGEQFLKHLLILLATELKLDPLKVFEHEFGKVIVRREHEHIDLLVDIQIKGKSENILLVVENKVDSSERIGDKDNEGQLPTYRKAIENEYRDRNYKQLFLFLTPDKREPIKDTDYWTSIDYNLIYDVLFRVNIDSADNTVKTLINDYRKLIRSEFQMENDEITRNEAIKIYSANPDIFDFIFDCKPNRVNKTADIIRNFIKDNVRWVTLESKSQNRFICFRTNELESRQNIWFEFDIKYMQLACYVRNASDIERNLLGYEKESRTFRFGGGKQWLFGNKARTSERVDTHDEYVSNNNLEPLKADCEEMLAKLFAQDEWVARTSKDLCSRLQGGKQ